MAAISACMVLLAIVGVCGMMGNVAEGSLAVGRHMRPGRSLAVGRTFRPGRSLASGRPYFRPGKRAPEVEESYMSEMDKKTIEEYCKPETIDDYTVELIIVIKKMVDFERVCGEEELSSATGTKI